LGLVTQERNKRRVLCLGLILFVCDFQKIKEKLCDFEWGGWRHTVQTSNSHKSVVYPLLNVLTTPTSSNPNPSKKHIWQHAAMYSSSSDSSARQIVQVSSSDVLIGGGSGGECSSCGMRTAVYTAVEEMSAPSR
jgi:hypothetical protein